MLVEIDGEFKYMLGSKDIIVYEWVKSSEDNYLVLESRTITVPIYEKEKLVCRFE